MFDVGFWEVALIGVIALLVVGPERLPALARNVGLWVGRLRRYVAHVKQDIEREIHADEMRELIRNPDSATGELSQLKDVAQETASAVEDLRRGLNDAAKGGEDTFRQETPGAAGDPSLQQESSQPAATTTLPASTDGEPDGAADRPDDEQLPSQPDETEDMLPESGEMTFVEHLIEVRNRMVKILAVVLVALLCLFPFANDLYLILAEPLMRHMPEGTSMIATEVAAPFLTPFKLALVSAIFVSMPVALYHLWAFVAPGLYRTERKLVYPLMLTSSLLFYLGMAFAYYVVFPLMFGFFSATAPEGVAIMTDISRYLDFVLKIFFAFGIAFEVPIATILVVWAGFTTPKALSAKRPYVIVGAFVVGMLLTPPDAISQTLLALPVWVLFELGLLFSRLYMSDSARKDEADEEDPASGP